MIINFEESVFNKIYNNLAILCRDLHLEDIGREYIPGKFIMEKELLECTPELSGFTCDTRFLIFSNMAEPISYFDTYIGLDLFILDNFSYFKIIDNCKKNGIRQISLLHIVPESMGLLNDWNEYDESIKKLSREILSKCLKEDINDRMNSKLWKGRCFYPVGMDEDMEFYSLNIEDYIDNFDDDDELCDYDANFLGNDKFIEENEDQ